MTALTILMPKKWKQKINKYRKTYQKNSYVFVAAVQNLAVVVVYVNHSGCELTRLCDQNVLNEIQPNYCSTKHIDKF